MKKIVLILMALVILCLPVRACGDYCKYISEFIGDITIDGESFPGAVFFFPDFQACTTTDQTSTCVRGDDYDVFVVVYEYHPETFSYTSKKDEHQLTPSCYTDDGCDG